MAYKYFTREEYTKGRDKDYPLSAEQEANMDKLLKTLDQFREAYGKALVISSGYRPAAVNASVGGAKKSNHIMCLAVDFVDKDGSLDEWCLQNLDVLERLGLYLESPLHTPNWCHVQLKPTRNRVFIP